VAVNYELYYWDSLDESNKLSSKTENITVGAKSSKEISYTIASMNESVYYLKITAIAGNGSKSIINIRIASDVNTPRENYSGFTSFPIIKGQSNTLFACFHNTSSGQAAGNILIVLTDKEGKEIASLDYSTSSIPSSMQAVKTDFVPAKDYDYAKITYKITDKAGRPVDSYSAVYDCADINSPECAKMLSESGNFIYWLILLFIIILLAVVILVSKKMQKKSLGKNPTLTSVIILFLAISGLTLWGSLAGSQKEKVFAQADPAFNKSQSVATARNYNIYEWDQRSGNPDDKGANSVALNGSITAHYNVEMTKGEQCNTIGDQLNFDFSTGTIEFFASGGNMDSPYGTWCSGQTTSTCVEPPSTPNYQLDLDLTGGSSGWIKWAAIVAGVSISSSNPASVSCYGLDCLANASGTATLTANIEPTTAFVFGHVIHGDNHSGFNGYCGHYDPDPCGGKNQPPCRMTPYYCGFFNDGDLTAGAINTILATAITENPLSNLKTNPPQASDYTGKKWILPAQALTWDVDVRNSCSTSTPPVETDLCPNIAGIQTFIPAGMVLDASGNCVTDTEIDLCPNIAGIQTSVPAGLHIDAAGNCVPDNGSSTSTPPGPGGDNPASSTPPGDFPATSTIDTSISCTIYMNPSYPLVQVNTYTFWAVSATTTSPLLGIQWSVDEGNGYSVATTTPANITTFAKPFTSIGLKKVQARLISYIGYSNPCRDLTGVLDYASTEIVQTGGQIIEI
jgi:hypothetical protein